MRIHRGFPSVIHPTYFRYLIYRFASPVLLTAGELELAELLEELLSGWIPVVK